MTQALRSIPAFLWSPRGPVTVFASFCALFQVTVVSQNRVFYPILRALFVLLFLMLAAAFVRAASRRKVLWLALLLIVLIRVPFYLHSDGAILTSDNAHEALQGVEMRETHRAPYFLLGAVKHMGTIKYLVIAFLWDLTGNRYLGYLIIQTLLFVLVLFALYDLLRESLHPPTIFVLLFLTQFAFVETVFDFSLSLRGAPYLEMLFFAVLGAGLIDWEFRSKGRLFLGCYFLFFSIYIHPLAGIIVGSFGLTALVYALARRRLLPSLLPAAAGLAAGLYHWFYYLLFLPKPVATGGWETIRILRLSHVSLRYLGEFLGVLQETFWGVFGYEYSYLAPIYSSGWEARLGHYANLGLTWLSLAVCAAALVLSIRKAGRLVFRKEALRTADWPVLFYGILAGAFAVKAFLFFPAHTEPRHNFELVFLIILAYLIVFSAGLRLGKPLSLKSLGVVALAGFLTLPHYGTYLDNVRDKEMSYRRILAVLEKNHVRYVATDFIVAYPIYFLSGRTIMATDSLGPFKVPDFYPEMRAKVEALPDAEKAFLFFSERAPSRPWHKQQTRILLRRTLDRLAQEGIRYRTYELRDYIIVIPKPGS